LIFRGSSCIIVLIVVCMLIVCNVNVADRKKQIVPNAYRRRRPMAGRTFVFEPVGADVLPERLFATCTVLTAVKQAELNQMRRHVNEAVEVA